MNVRALPVLKSQPSFPSVADDLQKIESHEDAAHEKRNWVRLTYDCNNHCSFCLDSNAHDGTMRDDREIRVQIVEGRKKGASRLILSGGEPTMHPLFLDYVTLGKKAGYRWIQTVTNGRMFAYPEFLETSRKNGLSEITFSLHGHTAKLHDALVGTPGAFVEETAGLKAALASGAFVVNVDIVINKQNVRHLPAMMETFYGWGVREFDLLHIIPFGNAWTEARDHLFYDLDDPEIIRALATAFAYSRLPDVHVWMNRFPPAYAEGFEELIQDPYKLNDEVRGRREEFDRYLSIGQKLMCRQEDRCKRCYLQSLCDTLDEVIDVRRKTHVEHLRIADRSPRPVALPTADVLRIVAADVEKAKELALPLSAKDVWLELADYEGIETAVLEGKRIARVLAHTVDDLARLEKLPLDVVIAVELTRETEGALLARAPLSSRYVVVQPTYERVTDSKANDVELQPFFASLAGEHAVENVVACLSGRPPETMATTLDGAMLADDARIDMPKYAKRYVETGFFSKSIRCGECVHSAACRGMHINWVRAHGFAKLLPITAPSST